MKITHAKLSGLGVICGVGQELVPLWKILHSK